MSLFKKPSRKFRQRTTNFDSDEESDASIPKEEKELEPKEVSVLKPALKLSFHDDDEESGNVFKIKKSNYSKRMLKHLEKKKREKEKQEKPHSPKQKVIEEVSIRKKMEKEKAKEKEELNITWVGGPIKAKISEPDDVEKVNIVSDDICVHEMDEDESLDAADEFESSSRPREGHQFRGALERGVIPDAKTIYALKKQRQMARDATEFISLDNDLRYDDEEKSRPLRDNDDKSNPDDDDDEDDERIDFAVDKEALEREKVREAFLLAQEEEEDFTKESRDSEDELDRWEQEQIRKGVGAQNQVYLSGVVNLSDDSNSLNAINSRRTVKLSTNLEDKRINSKSIPAHVLRARRKVTREQLLSRLNDKLNTFRINLKSYERQAVNIDIDIEQCRETISKLESSL